MSWIAELLPLCFVRWFSQKYLQRMAIGERVMTMPRRGVFVEVVSPPLERRLYEAFGKARVLTYAEPQTHEDAAKHLELIERFRAGERSLEKKNLQLATANRHIELLQNRLMRMGCDEELLDEIRRVSLQ